GQVTRMLADVKGVRFVDAFTDQWLKLETVDDVVPNATQFPNFKTTLKQSMRNESRHFLRDVLRSKPISELITANYSYLNDELAAFYGIPVSGANSSFVKVTLPASSKRRGFLSQGAPLLLTFQGEQHRPVVRGAYVLD